MTIEQIQAFFLNQQNPYTKCTFKNDELPICTFEDEQTRLTLHFPFPKGQTETFQTFQRSVLKCLKIDHGIPSVKLIYQEEVKHVANVETPLQARDSLANIQKQGKPTLIGIVSGKGGVGKSQTAIGLAQALKRKGEKVAIIDADIYGASIQKILNNSQKADPQSEIVLPLVIDDMEVISSHMFTPNDEPIIWRGPMLGKLLAHFFNDVMWSSDNTFFLIDLPPGTGDIPLDLQQLAPELEIIVVTTPDADATSVAAKSGVMAQNMNQHIIGVIENMAYFTGLDGVRYHIFGKNGGTHIARLLNVPLLAQIPITSQESPLDMSTYFDQIIATLI